MINIQQVTNSEIYTLGTWTSQILLNSEARFPTGTTSEWGYLSWDETYTGTGYTGQVRIDILDSSGNLLLGDITKNLDGSPTDLSTTVVANSNIKIKVKLYGLDYPTPIVSNIKLNYKNWKTENITTNAGKNVLLYRSFTSPPTVSEIAKIRFGNAQTTAFNETSTDFTNPLSTWVNVDSVSYDEENNYVILQFEINNGETYLPNNTILNAIGFGTNDASPYLTQASRFYDLTKESDSYYRFTAYFKVLATDTSSYVLTKHGRNVMLNRTYKSSPDYTYISKYVLGYTGTLSNTMSSLDSELVGPTLFTYSTFDTSVFKVTTRGGLTALDGVGQTFNSIANETSDATNNFVLAIKFYESLLKTSNYIYQFDVIYQIMEPIASIG